MTSWGRKSLPALVLAGLLLLLAHDVLMAANPHGQATTHGEHAAEHTPIESPCHFQDGARTVSPGEPAPRLENIATHVLPVEAFVPRLAYVSWHETPGKPPGVRRALLQVFLN
jgi:hypothetical protein